MIQRVCVYCASSSRSNEKYLLEAYELGKIFAQANITTVYGGGSIGLMGALANGVLENRGKIIGIIPQFMMELEWGNPLVTELIVVQTMAERKKQFLENVDAVIAMPGGTGTLEELTEVISLKKLALFTKPIIILNSNGFYNSLLSFFEKMTEENFIRKEHAELYTVLDNAQEIIPAINNSPVWTENAIKLASY